MKFYFSGLLVLISIFAKCQDILRNRIGYVSDFSFFVETNLHLNDTIEYYPNNNVRIKLPVLSSDLRLGIPIGSLTYSVIHRLEDRPNRRKAQLSEIEYKIEGMGTAKAEWNKLKINRNPELKDSLKYLIDTILSDGQLLKISFKYTTGEIFQVIDLEKKRLQPAIQLFRAIRYKDTTIKSLRKAIAKENKYLESFTQLNSRTIQVAPGKCLELVFTNQSINQDSCILFRLTTGSKTGPWEPTGHFTLLRNLKSNQKYVLEVKYRGNVSGNKYEIETLAYWYQTSFAYLVFLSVILVLTLAIGYLRLKLKFSREKRKKEQIEYKLRAVQSQLNPHFIFNALSSIQSLINGDKKQQANQYLTSFSAVLRGALKNSELFFIPLAEELELLKNYLEIERLRFQFSYNFKIDEAFNLWETGVPPMLFQPSLENAIIHGIGKKGNTGIIEIQIIKQKDGFSVSIFDNGRWPDKIVNKGFGISLTKERIVTINEISKNRKIHYKIDMAESGTIVSFNFENWLA